MALITGPFVTTGNGFLPQTYNNTIPIHQDRAGLEFLYGGLTAGFGVGGDGYMPAGPTSVLGNLLIGDMFRSPGLETLGYTFGRPSIF